ncbi:unnamed protein product [Periconia digitata]|uniref:Uncharacterized protein n=1 Tax=Periconia digitata TaxID=1303443 RepID=A0A9W4UAP4_9PLEO|nr:unnamed protein product [Periconia digitata]
MIFSNRSLRPPVTRFNLEVNAFDLRSLRGSRQSPLGSLNTLPAKCWLNRLRMLDVRGCMTPNLAPSTMSRWNISSRKPSSSSCHMIIFLDFMPARP